MSTSSQSGDEDQNAFLAKIPHPLSSSGPMISSSQSTSPLNLNGFPLEVLIIVLSYVDPLTLRNIPLVCKTWNSILQDDTIWNAIFKLQYPYKREIFSSVTRSTQFKTELLHRTQLRYNYRRGRLLTQQYTTNHFVSGSSIAIDWSRNRLTIIDLPRSAILTCDIRNGKSPKFATDFVPEGVTSYDAGNTSGSLHGSRVLVFGRWDGSVSGALIDWKGLVLSDVHNWGSMSGGRVTCVTACVNSSISTNFAAEKKANLPPISSLTLSSPSSISSSTTTLSSTLKKNIITSPPSSSHNILTKSGMAGAFSADETGTINAWDIRTGECLCEYKTAVNSKIIKLQSDGKTAVIVLFQNGELWLLRNVFGSLKGDDVKVKFEKIGQVPFDRNGLITLNLFIDYGGESVVVWNEIEVLVLSYSNISEASRQVQNHDNIISYTPPERTLISSVSFESNDKLFIKRDPKIVGSDPLLAAVLLNNGIVDVINIREPPSSTALEPINTIVPKFLSEHESGVSMNYSDTRTSPVASVCLNSLVLAISNHLGKVELFDVMTGEYLRTAIDRVGKKKLQELEGLLPNRLINSSIKVYLDDSSTRGVLIIGSHIQYFLCGGPKNGDDATGVKKKTKSGKRGNDKKGDFSEDMKHSMSVYEEEKMQKKKERELLAKYNGEGLDDEKDQLNMAIVLSMSLNETGNKREDYNLNGNLNESSDSYYEDEEMRQLNEALKMSLNTTETTETTPIENHSLADSNQQTNTETETDPDIETDEDLLLAIELSKQENNMDWEAVEDRWESLVHK